MSKSWTFPFAPSEDAHIDLSSLDAYNNGAPYATFERMRAESGISWCEEIDGRGFWSVTRHADILALNKQPDLMSSAKGIRIDDQSEEEYEARKTFQETDGSQHTYFRMLVNKAFSRKKMALYEESIRQITGELIDEALALGELDATEQIAKKLPMRMLGQIIGVPEEDYDWLVEKGDALISNSDPDYTDFVIDKTDTDEYRLLPFRSPAAVELFDYANDLLKRMDAGESFGVLNLVLQPTKSGQSMSHDEFRNFFCLLVAAGNDTTRYSIAACIHAVANQPDLLAQIKDNLHDDAFMQLAADEMIRWASPTTHFRRTATRDFVHDGKQIKKGDKVVLWFLSANRDSEAFDKPYEINLARKPNKFISFGQGGPHVCLGIWLAKLEVKIVLEELAKRVSSIEQTKQHSYLRSNFVLGIKRLPVRMTAV
ncbi:MAG: cytochrome P450 [Kordiimonadaceae bacterium]|nr:cytochrome P450 [Kordiimonadaceae bacterium]